MQLNKNSNEDKKDMEIKENEQANNNTALATTTEDYSVFWKVKQDNVIIYRYELIRFLENWNIRMVQISKRNKVLVQVIDGSILREIDEYDVNAMLREHLEETGNEFVYGGYITFPVLSDILINSIKTIDYKGSKSNKEMSYVPYKNGVVKITAESIELIDYIDYEGHVFEDDIVDREIDLTKSIVGGIFDDFVAKLAHEDPERYLCFCTMLGYIIHDYKNKAKAKAIILVDEGADGISANGGTGKSLLFKGVQQIRQTHFENAKQLTKNQFIFQSLSPADKVLVMDDINEDYDFQDLFVTITDNLKIERKYKQPILVPFENSPKVVITTNFVIPGLHSASVRRRRADYEVSHYFSDTHTPEDEYGILLFDDFDKEEWLKFDLFMIQCVKEFLIEGLLVPEPINLVKNLAEVQTSKEFVEFMDNHVELEKEYVKRDLFSEFKANYPHETKRLTPHQLTKWIKRYCESKNYDFAERKSNNEQIVRLYSKEVEQEEITK